MKQFIKVLCEKLRTLFSWIIRNVEFSNKKLTINLADFAL